MLGDDCAFLPALGEAAVTVDRQAAGIHLPDDTDPEVFARRLLQVNLSDLAASGALGTWAFLGLSGPRDYPWQRFLTAFLQAAEHHSVTLAGGDLSYAETFSSTLTLIGSPIAAGRWLRRDAVQPGDFLWVGGALGSSALGCELAGQGGRVDSQNRVTLPPNLPTEVRATAEQCLRAHFCPQAQIELSVWLAEHSLSATDLSDGLSTDLHHLCARSAVGATVQRSAIALEPGPLQLANHLELAANEVELHGGEDYKLLFSLTPTLEPPNHFDCRRIGKATTAGGRLVIESGGRLTPLPDVGWDQLS